MNEGGWNLVEPEHASSRSMETESSDGGSMKEVSSSGRPGLKKEASFAWRGGQERQTTGKWICFVFVCVAVAIFNSGSRRISCNMIM